MAEAVEHIRQADEMVPVDLLAHTSPIGWEHIAALSRLFVGTGCSR